MNLPQAQMDGGWPQQQGGSTGGGQQPRPPGGHAQVPPEGSAGPGPGASGRLPCGRPPRRAVLLLPPRRGPWTLPDCQPPAGLPPPHALSKLGLFPCLDTGPHPKAHPGGAQECDCSTKGVCFPQLGLPCVPSSSTGHSQLLRKDRSPFTSKATPAAPLATQPPPPRNHAASGPVHAPPHAIRPRCSPAGPALQVTLRVPAAPGQLRPWLAGLWKRSGWLGAGGLGLTPPYTSQLCDLGPILEPPSASVSSSLEQGQ